MLQGIQITYNSTYIFFNFRGNLLLLKYKSSEQIVVAIIGKNIIKKQLTSLSNVLQDTIF